MKKKILIVISSVIAVILAVVIGVSAFFISDMNGSKNGKDIKIEIKQGTYTAQIAEILKDNGIISSPLGFRVFAKLKKYESNILVNPIRSILNCGDSDHGIDDDMVCCRCNSCLFGIFYRLWFSGSDYCFLIGISCIACTYKADCNEILQPGTRKDQCRECDWTKSHSERTHRYV